MTGTYDPFDNTSGALDSISTRQRHIDYYNFFKEKYGNNNDNEPSEGL